MNSADHEQCTLQRWPTLLCIDDDPEISEAIRVRLREYEVNVRCAYHGMHGIWLASTERPDLIVTDMRMPQGQGDYIIGCLRNNADTRAIPVIVLTGQSQPIVSQRVRTLDVQSVVTKPVPFDRLRSIIEQYIPLRPRNARSYQPTNDFQAIP